MIVVNGVRCGQGSPADSRHRFIRFPWNVDNYQTARCRNAEDRSSDFHNHKNQSRDAVQPQPQEPIAWRSSTTTLLCFISAIANLPENAQKLQNLL